jgi:hypothetical protein
VFGSSAFVTIVSGHSFFAALLTAAVAIISAIDNVVGFAERARVYSEQRRRYYDLYCEILISDPNKFNADQFREKRLRIDRDGPPPLRVLDVLCRNEEDIARGYNHDETIYVAWWRRLVAQFIDLPSRKWHSFEQLAQARNA